MVGSFLRVPTNFLLVLCANLPVCTMRNIAMKESHTSDECEQITMESRHRQKIIFLKNHVTIYITFYVSASAFINPAVRAAFSGFVVRRTFPSNVKYPTNRAIHKRFRWRINDKFRDS